MSERAQLFMIGLFALSAASLSASAAETVTPTCFIRPCELQGDFDGDRRKDVARLVRSATGKRGIEIRLADGRKFVVGAGHPTGSGGDDFDWMDRWSVQSGPIGHGAGEGPAPRARGDSLLVEKTESASGLIYWDGSTFGWYQQGD